VNVSSLNGEVSLFGAYNASSTRWKLSRMRCVSSGAVRRAGHRDPARHSGDDSRQCWRTTTDAQSRYRELGEALTRSSGQLMSDQERPAAGELDCGRARNGQSADPNQSGHSRATNDYRPQSHVRHGMGCQPTGRACPHTAFSVLNPNRFAYKLPDFSPADQTTYANHALVGIALSLSARTLTEEGALGPGSGVGKGKY